MAEKIVKCIIIGDCGVGKSSLVRKYTMDSFACIYSSTIGLDYSKKIIDISGQTIKIELWDTSGQERFRSLCSHYYRKAKIIVMCFDITDKLTFENLRFWYREAMAHKEEDCVIIVCGTKCDLEDKRQVSNFEATEYSKEKNIQYIEVSAKNDCAMLEEFFIKYASTNIDKLPISIPLVLGQENNKSYCCY